MWSWNPWGSNSIVPITEPKKFTAEYTREEHEAEYHSLPKSLWNEHTNKVYYSLYDAIEGLRKSLELSAHMKYWK